jgi:hypothetical protein
MLCNARIVPSQSILLSPKRHTKAWAKTLHRTKKFISLHLDLLLPFVPRPSSLFCSPTFSSLPLPDLLLPSTLNTAP